MWNFFQPELIEEAKAYLAVNLLVFDIAEKDSQYNPVRQVFVRFITWRHY